MSWYQGSIWQYGWVFPVLMVVFCVVMMVIMRGRCCPKGGWREGSTPPDDLPRDPDVSPRKEMSEMDAFRHMMNRLADR